MQLNRACRAKSMREGRTRAEERDSAHAYAARWSAVHLDADL